MTEKITDLKHAYDMGRYDGRVLDAPKRVDEINPSARDAYWRGLKAGQDAVREEERIALDLLNEQAEERRRRYSDPNWSPPARR